MLAAISDSYRRLGSAWQHQPTSGRGAYFAFGLELNVASGGRSSCVLPAKSLLSAHFIM